MAYAVGGPNLFEKLMNYDANAWANEATQFLKTLQLF